MKKHYYLIFLILSFLPLASLAAKGDQSFTSFKYAKFDYFDSYVEDGLNESFEHENHLLKTVSYTAPRNKILSWSLLLAFDEKNSIDRLNASLDWGGLTTEVEQGKLAGHFSEVINDQGRKETVFPQNQTGRVQTIIPSSATYENDWLAFKVGLRNSRNAIRTDGFVYLDYSRPSVVKADVSFASGLPDTIVDAESTKRLYAYWFKMDPLRALFQDGVKIPAKFGSMNHRPGGVITGHFFRPEILIGAFQSKASEAVVSDYRIATGRELNIADDLGYGLFLNYEFGYYYSKSLFGMNMFLAGGVEGWLENSYAFFKQEETASANAVPAELQNDLLLAWAFFLELGASW